MGDFVGGTLKYLRRHPVERLTIAGGFAKLAKLAAGHLDLHSARSRVDIAALAGDARRASAPSRRRLRRPEPPAVRPRSSRSPAAGGEALARAVAAQAREVALATLCGKTAIEVAIVDRQGGFLARVGG